MYQMYIPVKPRRSVHIIDMSGKYSHPHGFARATLTIQVLTTPMPESTRTAGDTIARIHTRHG